jgi:hypothetical protein
LTDSWMHACATTWRGCPPVILIRESKKQKVTIYVKNLVSDKTLEDLDDSLVRQIRKGRATTILYLVDSLTAMRYEEGNLRAKEIKPLLSKGSPLGQDVALDLTSLPDGTYVLIVSNLISEWDQMGRVTVKTE